MNKGFSKETVYSHLYEIKKSRVNLKISTPKKVTSAPTTPKKRKVATDAEENSWNPFKKQAFYTAKEWNGFSSTGFCLLVIVRRREGWS